MLIKQSLLGRTSPQSKASFGGKHPHRFSNTVKRATPFFTSLAPSGLCRQLVYIGIEKLSGAWIFFERW